MGRCGRCRGDLGLGDFHDEPLRISLTKNLGCPSRVLVGSLRDFEPLAMGARFARRTGARLPFDLQAALSHCSRAALQVHDAIICRCWTSADPPPAKKRHPWAPGPALL